MRIDIDQISAMARKASQSGDWARVKACAKQILKRDRNSPEGHFLAGLAAKASGLASPAAKSFSRALRLDGRRYDAAIELAGQHIASGRFGEAVDILERCVAQLDRSPRYLDMAGTIYTNAGLPDRGWPLYKRANELQPGVDSIEANLAACSVFVGEIDAARAIYRRLLDKHPNHQRNHYALSRIQTASDSMHIEQMKKVLRTMNLHAERNIFLYYAIGKELEDIGQWDEAFKYYEMAGYAAARVAGYEVTADLRLIDTVVENCGADWLLSAPGPISADASTKTPIFIVGLPRTGTTLVERIVSCHSQVESVGETYFLQDSIRRASGIQSSESMSAAIVEAAAEKPTKAIADGYMEAVRYKFGVKPWFIEKFPENFLYLGFIAKAFPRARIVCLKRHPMDACFAMFKQSFFRYAYTLADLGPYYVAHDRLRNHWRKVLKDRMIEVEYESLVGDQEGQTRRLLARLGLPFEKTCLEFHRNITPSNTASTVQVREKMHSRSVHRWQHFASHLEPLKSYLEQAGISLG
ncbi:MAG: hypothetical protein F4053_01975 [Proteobacteria bacterium]|nr:hypothetical protein [Pseudomonadota bacterium]MYJ94391.1 hypothetical protein [Pseudomonadota bacterium]